MFVPTPQEVVDAMLKMAKVTDKDTVYDLGCGDGRIIVTAAKKYGAKAFGVDLDPERVKDTQQNIKKNDVGNLVTVKEGDVLKTNVSAATVVTLYLLPEVNEKLKPILKKQLKPGSRIVSHRFLLGDWAPDKTITVTGMDGDEYKLHLWTVKEACAKARGTGLVLPLSDEPVLPGKSGRHGDLWWRVLPIGPSEKAAVAISLTSPEPAPSTGRVWMLPVDSLVPVLHIGRVRAPTPKGGAR